MPIKFVYPKVSRDECVDKIFDRDVPDPYRYLEDPRSERTQRFVMYQNSITEPYLDMCPHRTKLEQILTQNQDYVKIGCPFKRGNKYYFFMNEGLQPQSVLYQQDSIDGDARVFFDPNKLSQDGTVALVNIAFSHNGEYMAYGLSYEGSDWQEVSIRKTSTGEDLKDKLTRVKFSAIDWTHDNNGIFYAQFPSHRDELDGVSTEKNENHTVYYHVLGTSQADDILKVNFPEHPSWNISFEVSHDGGYLFVYPREGCVDTDWLYCRLSDFGLEDKLSLIPIYDKMDAEFDYISNDGETVYFRTNLDAKNYRVVKLNLSNPSKDNWVEVIPNHPHDVLNSAEMYTVDGVDYLLVNYLRKVAYNLELHRLGQGLVKTFPTPLGTISKYSGRRNDGEFFFHFTSFLTPGQTYHFNLSNLNEEARLLKQAEPKNFNSEEYTIEQVFYKSKDQTEVPMFIVYRKDMIKDGHNPCILYGYGGFNILLTSSFNINRIVWLKNFKGILAVANIRGGGELGQDWHQGGILFKKQNGFDDFIAAGEYLIENKYTSRDKIAIEGASNGGLLVAAVSNQRPDLFGATICHVGVLDMTRFAKFTIGHAWRPEYGDHDERDHFENLIKYSPYHNIPASVKHYPATLLLTAEHDDRVIPAHSYKFIAELQYKLGKALDETPLVIRIDTKAGHGLGRPVAKVIDEYAAIYSFLYLAFKLEKYFNV